MQLEKKNFKNFDILLMLICAALIVFGVLMIANATGNPTASNDEGWLTVIASMDKNSVLLTLLWVVVGLVAGTAVIWFDYHTFGEARRYIYWGTVAMLGVVLVIGSTVNNSKSWLFGGSVQPSEIAKLALILVLSKTLSEKPHGIQTLRELLQVLMLVGLPIALIIGQRDFGTMLVYVFITAVLLFVSGTNWKLLVGLVVAGGILAVPTWFLVGDVQRQRIMTFIDPSSASPQALYNVKQSITAIGSGQMTGRGFFADGSFCQLDYIPVKESDFIFSITGETMGFVGAGIIIALYALLLIRLLILSRRAFDRYGSYLIIGVMAFFAFHIFENVGMTMGVMPVTGIPLPFLSYGGSNMVTNLIAIGLVQNVCMRRRYSIFKEGEVY